jgi:hypothetical protein
VGTARVSEIDGEHTGREGQIDAEGAADLGETNQKPTISVPDTAGNGQSHGGGVARRGIAGVARAVEEGRASERRGVQGRV